MDAFPRLLAAALELLKRDGCVDLTHRRPKKLARELRAALPAAEIAVTPTPTGVRLDWRAP